MSDHSTRLGTVFIVDDDEAVRDSLAILLHVHGLEVEAFNSAAAFQRGYRARKNACLVLDHHMPNVTGLDFLRSSEGQALTLPVILVTAHDDKDIRAQAAGAGVFVFLAKPVDSGALLTAVADAIASGPIDRDQRQYGTREP